VGDVVTDSVGSSVDGELTKGAFVGASVASLVGAFVGDFVGGGLVGLPSPSTTISAQFQNCSGTPIPSSGILVHVSTPTFCQLSFGNGYVS